MNYHHSNRQPRVQDLGFTSIVPNFRAFLIFLSLDSAKVEIYLFCHEKL